MKRKIVFLVFLLWPVWAIAGKLDPIPGIDVSEDGVSAESGALIRLDQTHPIMQISAQRNSGVVTATIDYINSKVKMPKGTEFNITGVATGNAYSATVEEAQNFLMSIPVSEKNSRALIKSIGNFTSDEMVNENRYIFARGNSLEYTFKQEETE